MVDTIKFSEMTAGGDIANDDKVPGLLGGDNVLFNNPWTFLAPGTTAGRPTPAPAMYYRLRFNLDDQLYEYYDAVAMAWTQIQESLFTAGPLIIYEADAAFPDAFNLGGLASGILKQNVLAGVSTPNIAVNGVDYWGPGFTGYFQSPAGVKDVDGNIIVDWATAGAAASYYLTITSANAVVNAGPTLSATGADPNIPLILVGKGANGVAILGDNTGNIPVSFSNGTAYQHQTLFSFSNTAAIRTVTFPDADGTVAFTSGIPSLGDFTFTGDVMSTATLNTNLSIIPNGTGNLLVGDVIPIAAGSSGTLRTEFAKGGSRVVAPFATYQNNATGSVIGLVKSRSTTIGVSVAVQNGDSLGVLSAFGDDGTTINTNGSGALGWTVSGAVSAGIVPTQFTISTQTTAGVNNTALTISNAQIVTLAHALPTGSGGTNLTTFTNNGLFYASSASVMAQVTPVNSAVLITSAGGVPSLSTTLPAGLTIPGYAHSGANSDITSMSGLTGTLSAPTAISDALGNINMFFVYTASAVNWIASYNSATGQPLGFQANGSDTNVAFNIDAKGTGQVSLRSFNTTTPVIIWSGTGLQHTTSLAFANTAAARTVTFPDADGTVAFTSSLPTPAALTKTDDTNVTLTLGGTPATALLQATSLTLGWTGQLGLTRGGSNASLTASNGGIIYSTATAMAVLAGTATANQMLLSGASGAPAWSTVTHPATTTINQILYSSAANVISGLATANSAVLVTSAGGVPSLSTTLPNIAHGTPTSITLTNGTGLPIAGITGLGTGVATALAANVVGSGGIALDTDTTWTPVLSFGGASVGITYATQLGHYTRIGNVVTFALQLALSNKGSSTGAVAISLPIAQRAGTAFTSFSIIPGFTYTVPTIVAYGSPGAAIIGIQTYSVTGVPATLTDTNFSNTSLIIISGSYLV